MKQKEGEKTKKEHKRTKFSRGYIVVQRTPAEIEARMKALALVTGDG